MHFIDTYITELSTTHGLVCSRQDNSDVLKSELIISKRLAIAKYMHGTL